MTTKQKIQFIWSLFRWLLFMIILGTGSITAPLVYPIAYLLRQPLRVGRRIPFVKIIVLPLYIYLDDEDFEVPPYWWLRSTGLKMNTALQRFWSAYRWNAFRNTVWNFHLLTEFPQAFLIAYYSKGLLRRNFKSLTGDCFSMASLKYVDKFGNWSDNRGEFLSAKYSILGSMFTIYTSDAKKGVYWRYSYAGKTWLFGWTELQIGTNNRRYTIRFKIKGKQRFFEDRNL